jgi:hypothetical protein
MPLFDNITPSIKLHGRLTYQLMASSVMSKYY